MTPYWKRCSDQDELLILFNGWGCDETPYENINVGQRDFLILSDYTEINDIDFDFLDAYRQKTILAWSFGVYIASHFLATRQITCSRAIAVNGTPCPIDDQFGIPKAIFDGTLNSYNEENRRKFERRMLGRTQRFFSDNTPFSKRSTSSQLGELAALASHVGTKIEDDFYHHSLWSLALIAEHDRIFPYENMKRYWGEKSLSVTGDHFPDFSMIIDRYCFSDSLDIEA